MRKRLTLEDFVRGAGTDAQRQKVNDALNRLIDGTLVDHFALTRALDALQALLDPQQRRLTIDRKRLEQDPRTAPVLALIMKQEQQLTAVRQVFSLAGARGGKKADSLNKNPAGLTATQARRRRRFLDLEAANDPKPLHTMAAEDECTVAAMRESLKAAGLDVSAKRKRD